TLFRSSRANTLIWNVDPRHSLVAGVMWLIIALALTFSVAAAVWVGRIARENVIEQHVRRLSLETDQLASELRQALASRLGAVRAAESIFRGTDDARRPALLADVLRELKSDYPSLDWIAIVDSTGRVMSTGGALPLGSVVSGTRWFDVARREPWIGLIDEAANPQTAHSGTNAVSGLGDMAVPIHDESGAAVGVIAAHLSWLWTLKPLRLTDELDPRSAAQAFILDRNGLILVGPNGMRGKHWDGVPVGQGNAAEPTTPHLADPVDVPQFERLPNGEEVLVARELLSTGTESTGTGSTAGSWIVQLSEPNQRVYQRANALVRQILWVSLCLGAVTALLGVLGARHLTSRLKRLTRSVASVGQEPGQFAAPGGLDEVAQLGSAFAKILGDLQQERGELERRVAVRTQEVQRLAEESRYAAIVRERLQIARDLHDTLAHSMMAMLSEIRLLRRLQVHDPQAVATELARAEEVAHDGLNEARAAITQMRLHAVRETGLGPALSNAFERFIDRTALTGEFSADAEAARFGDERAEMLLRMAQEIFRNIERHAMATRVGVKLQITDGRQLELHIEDNGIGFDPQVLPPEHYGIVGLREQAELIGAVLLIESKPNQGTRFSILLRLPPEAFNPDPKSTLPSS
ncbi:MAG TPA: histidine kinase, partial [Steroidobacteraceae bacterium]